MTEQVVLLDELGNAVGAAPKLQTHHRHTPLHLAFSCYVFNADGALLVTRRALHKKTWPGEWTNTACGHPAPGEAIADAVRRRTAQELGISLRGLQAALPTFRYQATMAGGVMENEICPVFTAVTDDLPRPDSDEVDDTEWMPWPDFRDDVVSGKRVVSPWCVAQVRQLVKRADSPLDWPLDWPPADWSALPPAATGRSPGRCASS